MKGYNPLKGIGESIIGVAKYLLVDVPTTYMFGKLNENPVTSTLTDYLGFAIGPQDKRFLYFEKDENGNYHFLGASDRLISDPMEILSQRSLEAPEFSITTHKTRAVETITSNLFGDPKYDPLFNRIKSSLVAEQVKFYELYGHKRKLKGEIYVVDRFDPHNLMKNTIYWGYRSALFSLITPIAKGMAKALEKVGISSIPIMSNAVKFWENVDHYLTGIPYLSNIKDVLSKSPTYDSLVQLQQRWRELENFSKISKDPSIIEEEMNEIKEKMEMLMGKYGMELL
ncbi:MAG: hypothetical protein J7K72_04630 [Candidatus Aenigmarchaeota archaeon]|nr:hypothetical protein [Candidatus Aenigmarchaeota archaeon]